MDTVKLHTKGLVDLKTKEAQQDLDKGIVTVVASTSVVDRYGDSIDQNGWDLRAFKKNPVILWGHNASNAPIGKAIKVWIDNKGQDIAKLMIRVQFDMNDNFAADIFRKVKEGFISTVSVGFMPTEWEKLDPEDDSWFPGLKFLKQQLLETSFVSIPANPEALVQLQADGIQTVKSFKDMYNRDENKELEVFKMKPGQTKGSMPDEDTEEITDEELETAETIDDDAEIPNDEVEEAVENIDTDKAAPMSDSWDEMQEIRDVSDEQLETMGIKFGETVKFIHHNKDGEVNWKGLTKAMATLLGFKRDFDMTKEEKELVYSHLAEHYKAFSKEAPEFSLVELDCLSTLEEEILTLALDREERHQTRLIKQSVKLLKTIKNMLEDKKEDAEVVEETVEEAVEEEVVETETTDEPKDTPKEEAKDEVSEGKKAIQLLQAIDGALGTMLKGGDK